MPAKFDVCIRGAGIVGQTLALLLAQDGLRVALVRRPPSATPTQSPDVRAYALNAASRSLLQSVRAWPDPTQATAVRHMRVQCTDAAQVCFDAQELDVDALTWIVDVPALEARLEQAISFQPLIELAAEPQSASLSVVSEGRASQTRTELGVAFTHKPYGQTAIATRLRCQNPHAQTAYQWFADGEILALLPLDGDSGNSVAVVWSVNQSRAADLMSLPQTDFAACLRAASHGVLGDLELLGERAAWPLYAAQAQKWVGRANWGAWALVGDAAHAVHPLAGQGLNIGLEDVAELSQVLHGKAYWREVSDMQLLRRYERARAAALLAKGGAMDGLQQLFTRPGTLTQTIRHWGMQAFDHSGPVKRWVAQRAMGLS